MDDFSRREKFFVLGYDGGRMSRSRLITALDVKSPAEMKTLVDTLGESVSFYKVGMELFYSAGTLPLDYLKTHKKHVFLDLKLHDIPNT
ncbi:MAG: orotidine 5'-phosphate decarboxylase / HUMPS family protein, partial [Finegoldia magna]|nr:orotidine 5'-phosphate decarboxylase / HUMPS family protein [Finegoldia magna]